MKVSCRARQAVVVSLALLLSACKTVGPDYTTPETNTNSEWIVNLGEDMTASEANLGDWWTAFNDPVLNQLVEVGLRENNNLEIAGLRVYEARAQLGIATGGKYPQSQLAFGDATYVSPAENTGNSQSFEQYSLGASAAWELDFWGKFANAIESADAAYLASIAAFNQSTMLLLAQIVDNYVVIRSTEEQLRIARENLDIQQRSFDIAEVLFRNGEDSELDMQQAGTLLLSTKATIPGLETSLVRARNALSILLGMAPGSVTPLLTGSGGIPSLPEDVAIGVPADLLRNRPDVAQAELIAMSSNAQVGLAQADLYPSFSLVGSVSVFAGSSNTSFGDLFDSEALTYSFGPSFVWPFLNYGRIKNNVRVQDARLQQALISYRETALQAAREVEDAIAGFVGAQEQTEILELTVQSAERSNQLSTIRYSEGFSDYQRVLDSQQALFTQQQRFITAKSDTVRNLVDLYLSIGGGLEIARSIDFIHPDSRETMIQRTNWGGLLDSPDQNTQTDID